MKINRRRHPLTCAGAGTRGSPRRRARRGTSPRAWSSVGRVEGGGGRVTSSIARGVDANRKRMRRRGRKPSASGAWNGAGPASGCSRRRRGFDSSRGRAHLDVSQKLGAAGDLDGGGAGVLKDVREGYLALDVLFSGRTTRSRRSERRVVSGYVSGLRLERVPVMLRAVGAAPRVASACPFALGERGGLVERSSEPLRKRGGDHPRFRVVVAWVLDAAGAADGARRRSTASL